MRTDQILYQQQQQQRVAQWDMMCHTIRMHDERRKNRSPEQKLEEAAFWKSHEKDAITCKDILNGVLRYKFEVVSMALGFTATVVGSLVSDEDDRIGDIVLYCGFGLMVAPLAICSLCGLYRKITPCPQQEESAQ